MEKSVSSTECHSIIFISTHKQHHFLNTFFLLIKLLFFIHLETNPKTFNFRHWSHHKTISNTKKMSRRGESKTDDSRMSMDRSTSLLMPVDTSMMHSKANSSNASFVGDENEFRGNWASKTEFWLSCIGVFQTIFLSFNFISLNYSFQFQIKISTLLVLVISGVSPTFAIRMAVELFFWLTGPSVWQLGFLSFSWNKVSANIPAKDQCIAGVLPPFFLELELAWLH